LHCFREHPDFADLTVNLLEGFPDVHATSLLLQYHGFWRET
jgi:hypothetical protein